MRSFALPMSTSASHSGGIGAPLVAHTTAPDWVDCGIAKLATPAFADVPSALIAIVSRCSWRKSRPGRVRRTDAEFGMVWLFGNPPGRGVVPHAEQPPEQPPPLHDATRRRST